MVAQALDVSLPEASFYLWAKVPGDDAEFAPASSTASSTSPCCPAAIWRDAHGVNPGAGYIRIALVAPLAECQRLPSGW